MRGRARNRKAAELEEGLNRLARLRVEINSYVTFNPTVLREQLNGIRESTLSLRQAVFSILDRAIARDPAVFTKNDDTPEITRTPLRGDFEEEDWP